MSELKTYVVKVTPRFASYIPVDAVNPQIASTLLSDEYDVHEVIEYKKEDYDRPGVLRYQFEYDESYSGGDYSDVGDFVYVPAELCDLYGNEVAFELYTGLDRVHIINVTEYDEYYDCSE